jgi:hypothetical protein
MLNTNTSPTRIAIIPITTLIAENPIRIIAKPKNIKLTPMRMDTATVPKTGKIKKINPKIIDNIPDSLFGSMFFLQKFVIFTFQVKNSICFCMLNYFSLPIIKKENER